MISSEQVKQRALQLGFNLVGVIPAERAQTYEAYLRWIDAGMHADMNYMARSDRQARRYDLDVILPGVRSMLVVGMDYRVGAVDQEILEDRSRGRFASYAWGLDYHDVMLARLEELAGWLRKEYQLSIHRAYVDTGAILERAHGNRAGLGFVGKNTMLIHPRRGSYFFLGEILLTEAFSEYDQASRASQCGSCTRCLVACPTKAFPEPYVLDARRCISYLTIENKGQIAHEFRPLMGNWVFGCDICQDVCPWQRFSPDTREAAFVPVDLDMVAPPLIDLLMLDKPAFAARYRATPIFRIKRERLVRNACIVAGNWADPQALPHLRRLMLDESPLIRSHAAWAVAQIAPHGVIDDLRRWISDETDAQAAADMKQTLQNLEQA